jgi:hypothetical protein
MEIFFPQKEGTQPLDLFCPFYRIIGVLKERPKIEGERPFFRRGIGGDGGEKYKNSQ